MTPSRPKINSHLLAELIESAPQRVRARLDKNPSVALEWAWTENAPQWSVAAGEETVQLNAPENAITSLAQICCSCLLTPQCFHVLACASVLAIADEKTNVEGDSSTDAIIAVVDSATPQETSEITDEMRSAAEAASSVLAGLLRVGAKQAGLLVQSTLHRAAHQSRAAGLVLLGNTLLSVAESVGRLRRGEDTADAYELLAGVTEALTTALVIARTPQSCPKWRIGQTRRSFENIDVRKLEGVFAEPILTLSGYAGVCVYLQSSSREGWDLWTINELRTGDAQLVDQAYRGGIDLGMTTLSASQLCRSTLTVQNLQATSEGRLGKGKSTRWALNSGERKPQLDQGRFSEPLADQVDRVFRFAEMSPPDRTAGWDLVAAEAVVLGASQSGLLVRVSDSNRPWNMRIAIDDPQLLYRENLQLLARCPGLALRCVGRLRLTVAGEMDLLAIRPSSQQEAVEGAPQLLLPETYGGQCNVGLDRLQRPDIHGVQRWSEEVTLDQTAATRDMSNHGLSALDRRLIGLVLGGRQGIAAVTSTTHRRDHARLRRQYQTTASDLLDQLAAKASRPVETKLQTLATVPCPEVDLATSFLATATYVRAATTAFHARLWKDLLK